MIEVGARAAAQAAGEKHYHGRPCRRGHTWRWVANDRCVDCMRQVRKYEAHPREKVAQVAIAAGAKFYMGQPCAHGHAGMRYVSNKMCVECAKARALVQEDAGEHAHNEARRHHAFMAEWYPEEFDRQGWRRGKTTDWGRDNDDLVWGLAER